MLYNAKLSLGDQQYDVIQCSYCFRRDVDSKGRPTSGIFGGTIELTIESSTDTEILVAMLNNKYQAQHGAIRFFKSNDSNSLKSLVFNDGFIIAYQEHMDLSATHPMTIKFTISARKISVGEASHENDWPNHI